MLCHNCGGENRDDYKFCVHCGVTRESTSPDGAPVNNNLPPAVYQPAPEVASITDASAAKKRPLAGLFKNKAAMIALVIGLGIVCLLTLAIVVVFIFPKIGGSGSGIFIGMPNRDGEADLYTLRLGQDIEQATLLAEHALRSTMNLYDIQDGIYSRIGTYTQNFGGFVPNQNMLVFWYADSEGEVFLQRYQMNQDVPTELYHGNFESMSGSIYNNGQDIFLIESTSDEHRCYVSANGTEADRVTRGSNCYLVRSGSSVVTSDINDNETTLTLMNPDGSNEITILDAQPDVQGYRVSYDGSRVAYVSTEDDQQIILVNGQTGEEITRGEISFNILSYFFAYQSNRLIYITENEDGELELYLLDDDGSLLVASALFLNADISNDGRYIIYMTGDEDGEQTVFSYNVSNGESTEITQGQGLRYNLDQRLQWVLVAQQDEDNLTLTSTPLDGSNLVTLYDDSNSFLGEVSFYPERKGLFIRLNNDIGETSLFYTQPDSPDGYFLFEEYSYLNVLDLSPDGSQLLVVTQERPNDDPALMVQPVLPDQNPVTLDDSETAYPLAVFTSNGRQVIYTAQTGNNADDYEIRQIAINAADPAETIYPDAYLVDVQWTSIQPFTTVFFAETLEGSSYCPGAPAISVGSTLDNSLDSSGRFCYRFQATAGTLYTFRVEAEFDTVLELYDRDGNQVSSDDDSGPGFNPRLSYSLSTNGTYYIVVRSFGSSTGSYSLSMTEGIIDPAFGAAIPLAADTLTRGYITSANSLYIETYDYTTYGVIYSFEGTANQSISIDVYCNSLGSSVDSVATLIDPALQYVTADDDSGTGLDSQIYANLPTTGRYYIIVEDHGSNFGSQSDFWFDILLTR
jgi:hypothetical protein